MRGFKVLRPKFVRDFEENARTQARFHQVMAWFWLLSMVGVLFIDHPHTNADIVALVILEVSLYANFATEFGALSASQASVKLSSDYNQDSVSF